MWPKRGIRWRGGLLVLIAPLIALSAVGVWVAVSRGSGSHDRGSWSRPVRLLGSGRYTFAPKVAVAEDGQMIAAWYARTHPLPLPCACGETLPARRSPPAHRVHRRISPPKPTGTKVVVDPGALPSGFRRPLVVSSDGTDVEEGLQVAVSSSHVAYVAFEDAHGGWRIVALHGGRLTKPVGLPRGRHGASQLQALLSPREGPVTAVWLQFAAHHLWSWRYAHLRADGTLGRAVTIARVESSDGEGRFAVNDDGALAAAWVQGPSRFHPHATALLVRCSVSGACSPPTPVSLGAAKPEEEEVALALSDDGRLSVLAAGHDRGSVEPSGHGARPTYTPGANYGLWGASAPAGAKLGALARISTAGASPVTSADGIAGAIAAFQLPEPEMRLGLSLRKEGQSMFGKPLVIPRSSAPLPPALVANLAGQLIAAWKQPTGSGRQERFPIEVLRGQGTHLGPARRLPATAHSAGATLSVGIDAHGDAIVLWDRSCKDSRTCGVYASIFRARPSGQRIVGAACGDRCTTRRRSAPLLSRRPQALRGDELDIRAPAGEIDEPDVDGPATRRLRAGAAHPPAAGDAQARPAAAMVVLSRVGALSVKVSDERSHIAFGRVRLRAGTLYTALDRLRADRLIEVDREEIVDNRPRRYTPSRANTQLTTLAWSAAAHPREVPLSDPTRLPLVSRTRGASRDQWRATGQGSSPQRGSSSLKLAARGYRVPRPIARWRNDVTLILVDTPGAAASSIDTNFEIESPAHRLLFHDFPRRVRALFGGELVLDTRRAKLLHETGLLPVLYVPAADVRDELLSTTDHHTRCPFKGLASYWSVHAGERTAENAAWAYPEPLDGATWLRGYIAFYWERIDAWFDEDEEVRGHIRDPFHRVDVRCSSRHVRVLADGELLAETRKPKLLSETGLPNRYYVPPEDVRSELLQPSATHTDCPYKGTASYRTVQLSDRRIADAAWFYPQPLEDALKVRDHFCFMGDGIETIVDGERLD